MKKILIIFTLTLSIILGVTLSHNNTLVHADTITKSLNPTLETHKRKLGVSKIEYSNWASYNTPSTRAKRFSLNLAEVSVGVLVAPLKWIGAAINTGNALFSLVSSYCIQGKSIGDVWPHYTVRNILGYNKAHYWEIIGQEAYITMYGNSSHSFVKAHAHYYHWVN